MKFKNNKAFQFSAVTITVVITVVGWLCFPKIRSNGFDPKENVFSAQTLDTLDHPTEFIFYSIDPRSRPQSSNDLTRTFHGYRILGKVRIADPHDQVKLASALQEGMAESDGNVAACFHPRHAISAKKGSNTVDIVVCFECLTLQIFTPELKSFPIAGSPRRTFDSALQKAGLPLDKYP